ncbi:phage head morphogenesis protein [[Clostridium] colinum]|uniref:phage head morphogenesis protein n=1 Tax=[Clostridium] colinum TaxID=36835 RepID=UPI00202413A0|nr:phage minor head protein [[Clostridium] colinum]
MSSLIDSKIKIDGFKFEDAIKYFNKKIPITKEDYKKLDDKYKNLAFTIANYSNINLLNEIFQLLLTTIEEGESLNTFKNLLNDCLEDWGYDKENDYKIDLIYRNNIQTAYQVGHYEMLTDSDVLEYRPYWQYDAIEDDDTRPEHKALDGLVFKADDPFWKTWYPPNGHRCRCTVKSLSRKDVERKGLSIKKGEDIKILPDKDFNYNPALKTYDFEVDNLPKMLKKVYENQNALNSP